MVEVSGFEPLTYRVQNGRSANWATPPRKIYMHATIKQHAYKVSIAYSPRMVEFFNHQVFSLENFLKLKPYGGPKSTRTTDLSVISGVL